jgi:hypothetical protein
MAHWKPWRTIIESRLLEMYPELFCDTVKENWQSIISIFSMESYLSDRVYETILKMQYFGLQLQWDGNYRDFNYRVAARVAAKQEREKWRQLLLLGPIQIIFELWGILLGICFGGFILEISKFFNSINKYFMKS